MFQIFVYEDDKRKTHIETEKHSDKGTLIYILRPTRLQSFNYKEKLRIELFKTETDKDNYGEIYCNILELEKDLNALKEFGTGFRRGDITSIRSLLERYYRDIETGADDRLGFNLDKDIIGIVEIFKEYMEIKENEVYSDVVKGVKISCIPVERFKEELAGSSFRIYDYTLVKEKLRDENFTKCNPNRSEYTYYLKKKLKSKQDETQKNEDGTSEAGGLKKVVAFWANIDVKLSEYEKKYNDKKAVADKRRKDEKDAREKRIAETERAKGIEELYNLESTGTEKDS